MYMDGFTLTSKSPDQYCLTYLVPGLLIDSRHRLLLACVITVVLSSMVELVTVARRLLPFQRQRDVGLCFYGASLIFAYFTMLLIMTYSLELFVSAVLGLLVGHVASSMFEDCGSVGAATGGGTPSCRLAHGFDPSTASPLLATTSTELQHQLLLSVSGMTCSTCVGAVQKALEAHGGVYSAQVSLQTNEAQVVCSKQTDAEALCSVVRGIGFEAAPGASSIDPN
jgi:copper chaperone CopZ